VRRQERSPVVVVGAGGHAKVIIDLLRESDRYRPIGCTDPQPEKIANGVSRLGDDSALPRIRADGVAHAFVALGDNVIRAKLGERA
jgi:UDP-perosamine 4-acetyltransferase